jgi:rare lipoprotein A
MLNVRRQTAPQVIQFFCPLCEVTPRSAFVLRALRVAQRRATGRMELSADSRFCGAEPNRGPSDCRAKDRGGKTASLPIYRRIQTGKHRPLKSGRQNGVAPQRKEAVVKGRMMLFVVSILAYQFSPPHLTPSAANQTGVASVYSHESGSGTASGQKLDREAFTAAHRTLPFGTKVKVTNKSNGRSVVVTVNDRGPFVRGRVIDVTPAAARVLGFSGLTQVALDVGQ